MPGKTAKTGLLKARCEPQLSLQVDILANQLRIDRSDIVRMACDDFVKKFQARQPTLING